MIKRILILLSIILIQLGCSSTPTTSHKDGGYTESGKASFYAMKFQSRKTANGERFNQKSHTAAHKKLPFGTKVKVTNAKNGKSIIVRINDRGPFIAGRIIDLSRSAFSAIGHLDKGILDVHIKVIR
ncbi:MAG: septal ring lytic transglycosylase RlpA family protein [Nitrosomonas sp.]|nr:septal ring lytic transglycosylase RlpA family protein [Nitrosomonas sp.]